MEDLIKSLEKHGISGITEIVHNPTYEQLYQAEMDPKNEGYEKGELTTSGAVAVKTGVFTGRSPKDRYIVKDSGGMEKLMFQQLHKFLII